MNGEIKRKRGRPKTGNAMNDSYRLRMDEAMTERLDNLCRITGMTKADIFREAFDGYEKMKLIQHERVIVQAIDTNYEDYGLYDDVDYDDFD